MKKITFLVAMLLATSFMYAADTAALSTAINSAQIKHDAAAVGSENGQYDPGAKELLQAAINTATEVKNNDSASQNEVNNAKVALDRSIWLFDKAKVANTSIIFYEHFGTNGHHANSNASSAMSGNGVTNGGSYYFNERIFLKGMNTWDMTAEDLLLWPGASGGSTVQFSALDGVNYDSLRIQNINTSQATTPKLRLATIYNWWPILASYSVDQGNTWVPLTKPAESDWVAKTVDGAKWELFTYEEQLPKVANLWIKIGVNKEASGSSTQIDDVTILDTAELPAIFGFNLANVDVDFSAPITATASKGLFNALDLSDIADPSSFFVLKKDNVAGANVAFSATISADKKTFTITPNPKLEPLATYYLALKSRTVAADDGIRVPFVEKTFKTKIDSVLFHQKIVAAEAILANPVVESARNGEKPIGSVAALRETIERVIGMVRGVEPDQVTVDVMVGVIQTAIDDYTSAIVVVDYDALKVLIITAEGRLAEADFATKYDPVGCEMLTKGCADAKTVNADKKATQAEVDKALVDLRKALNRLWLVGVEEGALKAVVITPNPANSYISIQGAENAKIAIYSATGAALFSIEAYNGENIDISSLAIGTYYAKINGVGYSFIKK